MTTTPTLSFSELRRRSTEWIRGDLPRAAKVAGVAFAISWLVNFAVITTRGFVWGDVIAASTEGEQIPGAVYWAILSLALSAVVAYGVEAGWSELRRGFRAVPSSVVGLFKTHGVRMWSIVFWGAAVTLAISGALAPPLSAALGIGFLAFSPTALTGILGRLLTRIWVALIGFFAPKVKPETPGLGGQLVVVVGSALGFLVASRSDEVAFKLIAAAALAVVSHLALISKPGRATQAAAFLGLVGAWWLGMSAVAEAFGGCCGGGGHHPIEDTGRAAGLSTIGGAAGAVGGVVGAAVGVILAQNPIDPSRWTDPGDGGPRITPDPIPSGPTRETTITLEGDEAREALATWREALAQDQQADIPLPEGEQWGIAIDAGDGTPVARGDHHGTRGRITGIGAVVEGDDGSIVISVDVTTYNPPGSTPPPDIEPGSVPTGDEVGGQPESAITDGTDGTEADTTSTTSDQSEDEEAVPPLSPPTEAGETSEGSGGVEDAVVVPPPTDDGGSDTADPTEDDRELDEEDLEADEDPKKQAAPDGSDATEFGTWVHEQAAGTLPSADNDALRDLISGERDDVTLSGLFEGKWAPLLGSTESRPDGAAVKFPTGDRVLVRVHNGRVEVKHEASLISIFTDSVAEKAEEMGFELPKVEDIITKVDQPIEGFNRALDATGRQVQSITRQPDGSIVIRTRPAG